MFQDFLDNLKVDEESANSISTRYKEITKKLNQKFRNSSSPTDNCKQVGSYGRYTGIKGISDLDMIYIMPKSKWDTYKNAQYKLLQDVKNAIKERYPSTDIKVDRLVVTVTFKNFHIEIQPVFEELNYDGSHSHYKFPDTYNGGSWKKTKPKQEIEEIKRFNRDKTQNHRLLCKMLRAWKNKSGVAMGGLLIDTLAYNYLQTTAEYNSKSFLYFDYLSRDFFKFLSEQPQKRYYKAPGSNQKVYVHNQFQRLAKKAYDNCIEAIKAKNKPNVSHYWKKIYGRPFPILVNESNLTLENYALDNYNYNNTEQFIEDEHPINIQYPLYLDCEVIQDGYRPSFLSNILKTGKKLKIQKKLIFQADTSKIAGEFVLYWKVLNRGEEAIKRNCIRGEIVKDEGKYNKIEYTQFLGEHLVECYAIDNNGFVVAKASIDVPIAEI